MEPEVKTICVKVASLRKVYGKDINLRLWLENPDNLYVGRNGRIFIDEEVFHYPASKWGNPFKVTGKDSYSLEESLRLYREHVLGSELVNDLEELKGKTLGCWCDQSGDCHAKVLKELYEEKVLGKTGEKEGVKRKSEKEGRKEEKEKEEKEKEEIVNIDIYKLEGENMEKQLTVKLKGRKIKTLEKWLLKTYSDYTAEYFIEKEENGKREGEETKNLDDLLDNKGFVLLISK